MLAKKKINVTLNNDLRSSSFVVFIFEDFLTQI